MAGLPEIVRRFAGRRVLVLGDMVADQYVVGRPERISREAPVLILHHTDTFVRPGGATNVAYNLRRLGADTAVAGIVGDDEMGRDLRAVLDAAGISCDCLLVDPHRPTSTKMRIVARGTQVVQQQIVRVDRVDIHTVDGGLRDAMIDGLRRALPSYDALLVSDYENGVISPELLDACLPAARAHALISVVDAHGDLFRFRGVTAATPNQPEAAATVGQAIESDEDLDRAGQCLLSGMEAGGVLITRGSEGIALYERGRSPYRLPAALVDEAQVVDPNGAGDTVAAVFTLALLGGATMRQAAFLGNIAGGEVVRRLGAATITAGELGAAVDRSRLTPPPVS